MREAAPAISFYDRMCWPGAVLERALATGTHREELIAWFGAHEYRRLTQLARAAARTTARMAGRAAAATASDGRSLPTVYLVPGLLGSQLGWRRRGQPAVDLLWLDATDICHGRLLRLRRRRGDGLIALGAIPHTYLALKLRLSAAGYRVVVHDYDWREDLCVSAAQLARRLERARHRLVLIGHSMGGLVARAALGLCAPATARRIERVIGLGTPHGGSIGAVQALRGTYPVVLRLGALDQRHDARMLTERVFRSFPSLYQMLPRESAGTDLTLPGSWPSAGPRPAARLLAAARRLDARLPAADARFVSIVGTGQRTVSSLALHRGQFRYEVSDAGDGTVPARFATLPGALNYSLPCEHSELPRSARVAAAILELLRSGRTSRLLTGIRAPAGARVHVSDAMLRRAFDRKLDWQQLRPSARRRYLTTLNAPPPIYRAPAPKRARAPARARTRPRPRPRRIGAR